MSRAFVFTKGGCPFCSLLKAELTRRGIPFEAVDLSDDAARQNFYALTGTKTVPQLYLTSTENPLSDPEAVRLGGWSEVSKSWELLDSLRSK